MKKFVLILALVLALSGCKLQTDVKLDTIVDIPLHPTEETAEATAAAETEPPTEQTVPTEVTTEKPQTGNSAQKPSGGKKPSKDSAKETKPKETKPAPTEPVTQPPTEAPTQPVTEAPTQPKPYDPSGYTPDSRDRGIADAVNACRREAGLESLTLDTRLCAIASVRAREASRVWSQSRPDGSAGTTVLAEYGYSYTVAAQNLYFGTGGAQSIVDKWMSSGERKANILMASATTIGVGSYTTADGLTYVAALFVG